MKKYLLLLLFSGCLVGFQEVLLTSKTVHAITYFLPEKTAQGDYAGLVIGRLADGNSLPVPDSSAKLVYENIPDKIIIFDGPYCASSSYDNHTASANNPCSSTNLNGEVYFDFQALNNDTGELGPARRVLGSTMAAAGGVNGSYTVDLTGLAGVAPSTNGKYFVQVRISWALQNLPSCVSDSPLSAFCRTGTNAFLLSMPRTTDLITYASTNADQSPIAILTTGPNVQPYSDYTFEFAAPCNASGNSLNQPLKWQDADYGQENQVGGIAWYLIDDSAPGGPKIVKTLANAELGGQAEVRSFNYPFEVNHKYRWVWQHVDNNNGIQAWLPFDSYNYVIDCSASPTPTPNPAATYTISGSIFTDTNTNGNKDDSENNYAVKAAISISPNAGTITTNNDGSYSIIGLPAGTYVVSYNSLPEGYNITTPLNGPPPSFQVTVGPGCNTNNAQGARCQ